MARSGNTSKRPAIRTSATRKCKRGWQQRGTEGKSSATDWECPLCSHWFSTRRNGPENHLRFCLPHHRQPVTSVAATVPHSQRVESILSELQALESDFSADSNDSSSDSDEHMDIVTTRRRLPQTLPATIVGAGTGEMLI